MNYIAHILNVKPTGMLHNMETLNERSSNINAYKVKFANKRVMVSINYHQKFGIL